MKCNKHGPIQYLTTPGYICVKTRYTIINFNGTDTLDSEAPELFLPKGCKEGFSKVIAVGDNFSGFFKILYKDKCNQVYQNGMVAIGQNTTSVELLYTKFGWEILTGASNTHSPAFSKELIEGTAEWQNITVNLNNNSVGINDFSISNVYTTTINNQSIEVRGIVMSGSSETFFETIWLEINANTNQFIRILRNDIFNNLKLDIPFSAIKLSRDGLLCSITNYAVTPNLVNFYAPHNSDNVIWTYTANNTDYINCGLNYTSTASSCIAILDKNTANQQVLKLFNIDGTNEKSIIITNNATNPQNLIYNTKILIYYFGNNGPSDAQVIVYNADGSIFQGGDSQFQLWFNNYVSVNGLYQQSAISSGNGVIIYNGNQIGNTFPLGNTVTKVITNQDDTDVFTISSVGGTPADIIWLHSQSFGNAYTTTSITPPQTLFPTAIDVSYDGKLLMVGGLPNANVFTIYFSQVAN